MFKKRAQDTELIDELGLEAKALAQNLAEFKWINILLGARFALLSALKRILKQRCLPCNQALEIADVGSGGGDLSHAVYTFLKKRFNTGQVWGIDANHFMTEYANTKFNKNIKESRLQFKTLDIYSKEFEAMRFDIVCLTNFCHHLSDTALIGLLQKLKRQTRVAIVMNDLHRHPIAYYGIKIITNVFNLSYLAKNDGPLSVLRAFSKQELTALLQAVGSTKHEIRWCFAFRWRVIVWV